MPTTLARIQVTQTEPVGRALAIAENEWPGVPRAELIARLMTAGAESLERARAERRAARRRVLLATQGTVSYEPGYLESVREDWPA